MAEAAAIGGERANSGPSVPGAVQEVSLEEQPPTVDDMIRLGQSYRKGVGVARSEVEALRWFRAAADRGSGEAHGLLGLLLEFGTTVPHDYPAARQAYARNVELGGSWGLLAEGKLLKSGMPGAPDLEGARALFERAADRGQVMACYELGWMEERGEGAPADFAKAFKWLERGARQGHGPSQNCIGMLLREGRGVARDDEMAVICSGGL